MEDDFVTEDMTLVAFLLTQGLRPYHGEWDRSGPRDNYKWTFEGSTELNDHVADYYGDRALVNPRAMNKNVASLKRSVFG